MTTVRTTELPNTVAEALALLDGRPQATIARNTVFIAGGHYPGVSEGDVLVELHGKAIALLSPHGTFVRHLGYVTATTQQRLQMLVPDGWKVRRTQGDMFAVNGDEKRSVFDQVWNLIPNLEVAR
jgi:hypothetical protein